MAGCLAALAAGAVGRGREAAPELLIDPAHRLAVEEGTWRDLTDALGRTPGIQADFVERRHFPFKREPVTLRGEVRVAPGSGLSLRYREPEERTVILDEGGVLVRGPDGGALPSDPRAAAANQALLRVLQLDLAALAQDFEIYGRRQGETWSLALVARTDALRRSVGRIFAAGEGVFVREIELRRTERQAIGISILAPHAADFSAEEMARFFR